MNIRENIKKVTICTGCQYLGNDGMGPGQVMLCEHEYFKDEHPYAGAIVRWNIEEPPRVMSTECPK